MAIWTAHVLNLSHCVAVYIYEMDYVTAPYYRWSTDTLHGGGTGSWGGYPTSSYEHTHCDEDGENCELVLLSACHSRCCHNLLTPPSTSHAPPLQIPTASNEQWRNQWRRICNDLKGSESNEIRQIFGRLVDELSDHLNSPQLSSLGRLSGNWLLHRHERKRLLGWTGVQCRKRLLAERRNLSLRAALHGIKYVCVWYHAFA